MKTMDHATTEAITITTMIAGATSGTGTPLVGSGSSLPPISVVMTGTTTMTGMTTATEGGAEAGEEEGIRNRLRRCMCAKYLTMLH